MWFNRDTEDDIAARRAKFIQAWRIFPDGPFDQTIRAASVDGLQWLIDRIDEQFQSVPLHVKDPAQLDLSIRTLHHCRTVVAQVLGNKRTVEVQRDRRTTQWQARTAIWTSIGSLIVAIVALIWTFTHSGR